VGAKINSVGCGAHPTESIVSCSDDGIIFDGTKLADTPIKGEIFTLDEIIELKN